MSLKNYIRIWLIVTLVVAYEYLSAHLGTVPRLTHLVFGPDFNPDLSPGRTISLYFGWIGFSMILLTNLYVFRKRIRLLSKWMSLPGWLNFHIFCGLLGPTFIVFHTNFKVGGLVAISFWSMVIVAVSGIVGRYFYVQIVKVKGELQESYLNAEKELARIAHSFGLKAEMLMLAKQRALHLSGLRAQSVTGMSAVAHSMVGDVRLMFGGLTQLVPKPARKSLKQLTIAKRREIYFEAFRQYLGYWHSFHLPFAYFMYAVAVIHIIVALLFQVKA